MVHSVVIITSKLSRYIWTSLELRYTWKYQQNYNENVPSNRGKVVKCYKVPSINDKAPKSHNMNTEGLKHEILGRLMS